MLQQNSRYTVAHINKDSGEKNLRDQGFRYECLVLSDQPLEESEILIFSCALASLKFPDRSRFNEL